MRRLAIGKLTRLREPADFLKAWAGIGRHGAMQVALIEDGRALYVMRRSSQGASLTCWCRAELGRALNHSDDVRGAEKVVVLSHRLWQRHYAGSRDVVGRRLPTREARYTIVGVMQRASTIRQVSITGVLPDRSKDHSARLRSMRLICLAE